jgi:hypothetical protein
VNTITIPTAAVKFILVTIVTTVATTTPTNPLPPSLPLLQRPRTKELDRRIVNLPEPIRFMKREGSA